jgi:IS5 family transposase
MAECDDSPEALNRLLVERMRAAAAADDSVARARHRAAKSAEEQGRALWQLRARATRPMALPPPVTTAALPRKLFMSPLL